MGQFAERGIHFDRKEVDMGKLVDCARLVVEAGFRRLCQKLELELLDLAEQGKIASLEFRRGRFLGVVPQMVECLAEIVPACLDLSCPKQLPPLLEQLASLLESLPHHLPPKALLALGLCRDWFGLGDIHDRCSLWGRSNCGWLINQDFTLIAAAQKEHKSRK